MSENRSVTPVWARVLSVGVILVAAAALNLTIADLAQQVTLYGILLTLGIVALAAGAVMYLSAKRN